LLVWVKIPVVVFAVVLAYTATAPMRIRGMNAPPPPPLHLCLCCCAYIVTREKHGRGEEEWKVVIRLDYYCSCSGSWEGRDGTGGDEGGSAET
jgi:hypothetical protein